MEEEARMNEHRKSYYLPPADRRDVKLGDPVVEGCSPGGHSMNAPTEEIDQLITCHCGSLTIEAHPDGRGGWELIEKPA